MEGNIVAAHGTVRHFGLVLILKIVEIFIQLLVKRPVFRQVRNAGCSSSCNG